MCSWYQWCCSMLYNNLLYAYNSILKSRLFLISVFVNNTGINNSVCIFHAFFYIFCSFSLKYIHRGWITMHRLCACSTLINIVKPLIPKKKKILLYQLSIRYLVTTILKVVRNSQKKLLDLIHKISKDTWHKRTAQKSIMVLYANKT